MDEEKRNAFINTLLLIGFKAADPVIDPNMFEWEEIFIRVNVYRPSANYEFPDGSIARDVSYSECMEAFEKYLATLDTKTL